MRIEIDHRAAKDVLHDMGYALLGVLAIAAVWFFWDAMPIGLWRLAGYGGTIIAGVLVLACVRIRP
jgi:NADH:ubiquinone oxidoreductase subunit 6 (subunit J)